MKNENKKNIIYGTIIISLWSVLFVVFCAVGYKVISTAIMLESMTNNQLYVFLLLTILILYGISKVVPGHIHDGIDLIKNN